MAEYATHGATLVCTCGKTPGKLLVTSNSLLSVQGKMVATVSDKIPMTNIMPFGSCSMKPFNGPCVPAPTLWTGYIESVEIPGGNPLLDKSTIKCACGGTISFQDSGQMRGDKVTTHPSSPQIDALRKAALEGTPFCEECEEKKPQKKPKILRIYWMDEQGEPRQLTELDEGQTTTLCVDVEEGGAGKTINLIIDAEEDRTFINGSRQLKYDGILVEDDNTAYIDDFKIEYKE